MGCVDGLLMPKVASSFGFGRGLSRHRGLRQPLRIDRVAAVAAAEASRGRSGMPKPRIVSAWTPSRRRVKEDLEMHLAEAQAALEEQRKEGERLRRVKDAFDEACGTSGLHQFGTEYSE